VTSSIRRPRAGDRVRKLADIHGTTIAWFTVTRVAFNPEGDYRYVLALEYGHEVDGNLCFHSSTAALDEQRRDVHAFVVEYKEAASEPCDRSSS
jgi:hypothetical protein